METLELYDDRHIESVYRFHRRLIPPRKAPQNPVLTATEPWESLLCAYGSVLRDEGLFKAYYTMWWLRPEPPHACAAEGLCYAFSEDGIRWTKPELGIVREVNGGRNNLIRYGLFADQPCVLRLLEPRDSHRYVMAYYGDFPPMGPGVRLCYSQDGIRWHWPGELIWQTALDTVSSALPYYAADDTITFHYDPAGRRYVLLRKVMHDAGLAPGQRPRTGGAPDPDRLQRRIARCESRDLVHWEGHRVVLAPDADDPPRSDFHRLSAAAAEEGQLGLLEVLDGRAGENAIALHLVWSDDGERWIRPCRPAQPFLPRGEPDAWDSGLVFTTSGSVVHGDEVLFYYGGMQARLEAASMAGCRRFGIGVARADRGRMCCLEAPPDETALLVTRPIEVREDLRVDATVSGGGFLRIGLLGDDCAPIPGFSGEDCCVLQGDLRDVPLAWTGGALCSRRLRVEVRARGTQLFRLRVS